MGDDGVRKYSIKRGHNPDIKKLLMEYFSVAAGDIEKGVEFTVEGIGRISLKKKGSVVFIETHPVSGNAEYEMIKKWNDFLYDLTGRTGKERRKQFSNISK